MNKKISIIVPIYNVEKYVIKCLDSLVNQTYNDLIVYAISDGSPDKSVELIKNKNYPSDKVVLIEKENGGYGSVLEYALKIIETEYFMICDPDDYLVDDAVEKLMIQVNEKNLDIIIGDKYLIYENSTDALVKTYSGKSYKIIPNYVYENDDIGMLSFLDVSPHAKIFRTSLAKNIIFPHKVSYTDFLLYLVCLSNSKRAMYINIPYAYYLIDRPGNTATDVNPKIVKYHISVWFSCIDNIDVSSLQYGFLLHRLFKQYVMITRLLKNVKDKGIISEVSNDINKMKTILKNNKKRIFKSAGSLKDKIAILLYL